MSFIRSLDEKQISDLLSDKNANIFHLLKKDILSGEVFPAVRKNQIYFYYEGGCLYRFHNGKFTRDADYAKYGCEDKNLSPYEISKKQVEKKFTNTLHKDKERRLLNALYRHTFSGNREFDTVVLDIEVNLNGNIFCGKKCDLLIYNVPSREIMFAEGKVFFDRRLNVKRGSIPEVIEQVNAYSAAIEEQKQTIIKQYENYVAIINRLFGTAYPVPQNIIQPAKLLVYETPLNLTENNGYSMDTINTALGKNNIVWFKQDESPSINEIWNNLCK